MSVETPPARPGRRSKDERAIRRLTADWLAAVRAKDIAGLSAMVTDDAVFLPPGFPPIRGKAGVAAMYGRFFPQFSLVEQTVSIEEIQVAGDWAFAWGSEKFTLVPEAGGAPIEIEGQGMSILKRQPEGGWKFARGINNTAPKPAPPAR